MTVEQWKHLKMDILQLCKTDPFPLLFTVTVFPYVNVCDRKNSAFYIPVLPILWHLECSKTKVLFLSYFLVFSISSVFLNYGFYLHGCAAVLIFLLSVYSLLRKMTDYSFVFS